MNKNVTFFFILKNILCVQFSSCHTATKFFSVKFFPNYGKSQNHTSTLFITCLLQKWNFTFTLRKTGPVKTRAAGPIPPALL